MPPARSAAYKGQRLQDDCAPVRPRKAIRCGRVDRGVPRECRLERAPSAATVVALGPGVTAGVGAPLDFAEYEAENGATNGRIVGPDESAGLLSRGITDLRDLLPM